MADGNYGWATSNEHSPASTFRQADHMAVAPPPQDSISSKLSLPP